MKWVFSIQPKIKAAFLLAIICVAVLVNMFLERRNISNINDSFSSIYEDRLLPATYVFHLTDHLYQKRLILDRYFNGKTPSNFQADIEQLQVHNNAMDTLIQDFEATYLVEMEGKLLKDLKRGLRAYNDLEWQLMKDLKNATAPEISVDAFEKLFAAAKEELTQLSQIQIEVGKKMKEDSGRMAASTDLLTNLDALLIIVMGLIIQILIFTSKTLVPKAPQHHQLN
ncbi:MAG: MCP four helix bundle domain-containing protein [Saprospiraceae bacterium]|nr:MCP four helix bundle domain-containing protein [Saprospiraceae bacterium]